MKKHLVAAAVAATLSAPVLAATDLDAGSGNGGTYASEIVVAPAGTNFLRTASADQTATALFGASFATDAVAYVRYDLTGGTLAAALTNASFSVLDSSGNPAIVSIAQGGGLGGSFVIFAVAPSAVGRNLVAGEVASFVANGLKLTSQGSVGVTYKLFETLTNAANNILPLKTAASAPANPLIGFASSFSGVVASSTPSVADVAAADLAYSDFVGGTLAAKPVAAFKLTYTARLLATGVAAAVGDILSATNSVTVSGDFTWADVVGINTTGDCSVANTAGPISAIASDSVTISGIPAAAIANGANWYVCATPAGDVQIPAGGYTGAVDLVANAGYAVSDFVTGTGLITRNGTVLKAAFAEASGVSGTSSAISLTNTRTLPASFTTSCITPTGRVAGGSGTVAGNSGTRFGITSATGLACPTNTRGIELTFAVPTGSVIGSVVRQNLTTGVAGFDAMVGNQ